MIINFMLMASIFVMMLTAYLIATVVGFELYAEQATQGFLFGFGVATLMYYGIQNKWGE